MENKVNRLKEDISPTRLRQINTNKGSIGSINKEKILKSIKENPLRKIENSGFANSVNRNNSKKIILNKKESGNTSNVSNNFSFISKQNNKNVNNSNLQIR